MTILIFSYGFPPSDGGVEVYSGGLARGLWDNGEAVVVLAPRCPGWNKHDSEQPFPIYRTPAALFLRELWMVLLLPTIIIKHRVTHILSTVWLPCGVISWLVTRLFKIPYYLSAHGSELFDTQNMKNPLKHQLRKRMGMLKVIALRKAQAVFAVSEYTRHLVIDAGLSPDRVFTVLNGVDSSRFKPLNDVKELKERYGLNGRKVLGTIGRLDDYKGHDTVIRTLPEVVKAVPEAMYLVVGRGPEKNKLEDLVQKLGMAGHVVFAGYVPDDKLVSHYNLCDLFIMVSRMDEKDVEGFGLVFLEANACGKAVIAGNTGGVSDAVVSGQTGVLVDPRDTSQITQAIISLLGNPEECSRLGHNGRRRAVEELDWKHVANRITAIIKMPGQ